MDKSNTPVIRLVRGMAAMLLLVSTSCSAPQPTARAATAKIQAETPSLELQARVMSLADDYISALGEAVYVATQREGLSPKGRWLAQSFLRNGVGASIDIGASPNPAVGLLDLLVLASLQTWSFKTHWIPNGIGPGGLPALARLEGAEAEMWASARQVLSDEQLGTLRHLIDAWIAQNSDRSVVALVRFDEFAESRNLGSASLRTEASGLLREVGEASGAIDSARLLGERMLWYAGRYPYILGEQAELTAYRLVDQPEGARLFETLDSLGRLTGTLDERITALRSGVRDELDAFFERVTSERTDTIAQAQRALETVVRQSVDDATQRLTTERTEAVDQVFDRLAQERSNLLGDLDSRQDALRGLMAEFRETASISGDLAREVTATVGALDRVVSRFDVDPKTRREPLKLSELRDAAIETTRAAEKLTRVLVLSNDLLEPRALDERIASLTDPANALVDRAFWRGVILICVMIGGLALLRLIPRSGGAKAAS